jgi:hypothetical protein
MALNCVGLMACGAQVGQTSTDRCQLCTQNKSAVLWLWGKMRVHVNWMQKIHIELLAIFPFVIFLNKMLCNLPKLVFFILEIKFFVINIYIFFFKTWFSQFHQVSFGLDYMQSCNILVCKPKYLKKPTSLLLISADSFIFKSDHLIVYHFDWHNYFSSKNSKVHK